MPHLRLHALMQQQSRARHRLARKLPMLRMMMQQKMARYDLLTHAVSMSESGTSCPAQIFSPHACQRSTIARHAHKANSNAAMLCTSHQSPRCDTCWLWLYAVQQSRA